MKPESKHRENGWQANFPKKIYDINAGILGYTERGVAAFSVFAFVLLHLYGPVLYYAV